MRDWLAPWWQSRHWTNVIFDHDGDAVAWCGHYHETAEEANACDWKYLEEYDVGDGTKEWWEPYGPPYVLHDFDGEVAQQCPHLDHPADCERCLAWICVHLQHPWECARCLWLAKGDYGEFGRPIQGSEGCDSDRPEVESERFIAVRDGGTDQESADQIQEQRSDEVEPPGADSEP